LNGFSLVALIAHEVTVAHQISQAEKAIFTSQSRSIMRDGANVDMSGDAGSRWLDEMHSHAP
jgi:hypothetical protein